MARTFHFRTLFSNLLDALADDRGRSPVPGNQADGVAICPHIRALSERLQRRVRVHHGGPKWNRTLPYRSTFEGRTGASPARLSETSVRHSWVTRTAPPHMPFNVSSQELPSSVGLPLPQLYSKHGEVPVATGWGRHTKVAPLSRWARPKTKAFVTPECAMNGTKIIGPSRIPDMAGRV